jgi:acyl-CoA thioesterase-1
VPLLGVAVLGAEVQLARMGPTLDGEPLALDGRLGSGTPVRQVVWLGDSTAAGVGASSPDAALPRLVAEVFEGTVELTVLAVSGARVDDVLDEQLPQVPAGTDEVFVSVGANDVTHLTRRGDFASRYRRLLDGLPGRVVVLGVPDMGSVPRLAQPLRAITGRRGRTIDSAIRSAAGDAGATYVDIAGETGPAFRDDPGRYFAADEYHPSDAGYRLWADAVAARMTHVVMP